MIKALDNRFYVKFMLLEIGLLWNSQTGFKLKKKYYTGP